VLACCREHDCSTHRRRARRLLGPAARHLRTRAHHSAADADPASSLPHGAPRRALSRPRRAPSFTRRADRRAPAPAESP
jgi:hypothetical protein